MNVLFLHRPQPTPKQVRENNVSLAYCFSGISGRFRVGVRRNSCGRLSGVKSVADPGVQLLRR